MTTILRHIYSKYLDYQNQNLNQIIINQFESNHDHLVSYLQMNKIAEKINILAVTLAFTGQDQLVTVAIAR